MKFSHLAATAAVIGLGQLLGGCAYLTPPLEHPIIEQHAQGRINTFAIIPSRRIMIVRTIDPTEPQGKRLLVCAEAPADVADNLANSLAASLAVSGPATAKGDKAAEASAAFSKTVETYAQFLFRRTQGIQLYRDRAYHLCQALMNDFINKEQYAASMDALFIAVLPLIKDELAHLEKMQAAASNAAVATANAVAVTHLQATASARTANTTATVGATK